MIQITQISYKMNGKDATLFIKQPGKHKVKFETLYNTTTKKAWESCCTVKGALNAILPNGAHARVEMDQNGKELF